MDEILFTSAALLDFLRQIDELSDKDISIDETGSNITVNIGESSYSIDLKQASDVEVEEEVVEEVSEVADEAFDTMESEGVELSDIETEGEETVEAGILSEALKSLLVGGMVRLTSKMVGKDLLSK